MQMEPDEWQKYVMQSLDVRPEKWDRERFLAKCRITGPCWIWDSGPSFRIGDKYIDPTKVAFAMLVGRVPENWDVVSSCGHDCCMPRHLLLVPPKEKRKRRKSKVSMG